MIERVRAARLLDERRLAAVVVGVAGREVALGAIDRRARLADEVGVQAKATSPQATSIQVVPSLDSPWSGIDITGGDAPREHER